MLWFPFETKQSIQSLKNSDLNEHIKMEKIGAKLEEEYLAVTIESTKPQTNARPAFKDVNRSVSMPHLLKNTTDLTKQDRRQVKRVQTSFKNTVEKEVNDDKSKVDSRKL